MEYTVVTGVGIITLIEKVNEYIKEGWKPLGGIHVSTVPQTVQGLDATVFSCYQAMTR